MPKQLTKVIAILFLSILSISLNAQTDSSKADTGININFFNGYAIAYKWNTSQNLSYRVYLNLYSSFNNIDFDTEYINSNSQDGTGTSNDKSSSYGVNISFQFLYNIISKKSLNLYLGIGPSLNYSYRQWESDSKSKYEDRNNSTYYYTNSDKSYGVGIVTLLGVEAFLTSNISFFAETYLSGYKSWHDYENINNRDNSNDEEPSNNKAIRTS
jgi:hypothetical protein